MTPEQFNYVMGKCAKQESGCIFWTGTTRGGYGRVKINGKSYSVHRLVWEHFNRDLRPGEVVRHSCDNPACVLPSHLLVGTQHDNIRDRVQRGRSARGNRVGIAKLTPEAVAAIRQDSRSQVAIAADYGVAPSTIFYARKGRTWGAMG